MELSEKNKNEQAYRLAAMKRKLQTLTAQQQAADDIREKLQKQQDAIQQRIEEVSQQRHSIASQIIRYTTAVTLISNADKLPLYYTRQVGKHSIHIKLTSTDGHEFWGIQIMTGPDNPSIGRHLFTTKELSHCAPIPEWEWDRLFELVHKRINAERFTINEAVVDELVLNAEQEPLNG